jgi:hypothetical protein
MKSPVQNITVLLSRTPGLWCTAVVAILRRTSGRFAVATSCRPERRASGRLLTAARLYSTSRKGPALFHSIKSVDNLVSIENGYQPVHRARSVARAECNVFPKDTPGVLDGRQYDVLIRGVHGARLLSAASI